MMELIYLSLGSNLGDRAIQLEEARGQIANQLGELVSTSGIYESRAWGFSSEHNFFNCCLALRTALTPLEVLDSILRIEKGMGRIRIPPGEAGEGYSDRVIDIDLLLFGDLIYHHSRLVLPHYALAKRRFVLTPLNEIAPQLIHPLLKLSISRLLDQCKDPGEVWLHRK